MVLSGGISDHSVMQIAGHRGKVLLEFDPNLRSKNNDDWASRFWYYWEFFENHCISVECLSLVVFLFGNEDMARQRYFKCFIFEIKTTVGEDLSHWIDDANSEDTETKQKVLYIL